MNAVVPAQRLLMVGWDSADWKVIRPLLARGEMPHLARLMEEGVSGNLSTLFPVLSPMLWNSISTGVRADRHGVLGFTEVCPVTETVRPVSSVSRKVPALWNMVHQRGGRSHVVNWFCSHPAEPVRGLYVSDAAVARMFYKNGEPRILPDTFHWDADISAKYQIDEAMLAELKVTAAEIDPSILRLFVPRGAEVDQQSDSRLGLIAEHLAETFTVHNYATLALSLEPWDFTAIYYPSIDHFSHSFMTLHPPRLPWIEERDFELYNDVINGAYRLHDLLLGRLLHLVGEETTVVLLSDHGFHSDHLRPRYVPETPTGPEVQHRNTGMLAMRGAKLKKNAEVYGANLLDITPTVLTLLGLPVGDDMPGRVLVEAFETSPSLFSIPTWESEEGENAMRHDDFVLPGDVADSLLDRFVGLGYIDPLHNDRTRAVEVTRREQRWNLARVHASIGRQDLAIPPLMELYRLMPDRHDIGLLLAESLFQVGLVEEAESLLQPLIHTFPLPIAHYLNGIVAIEKRQYRVALDYLQRAEETGLERMAAFWVRLGFVYFQMFRLADARRAFEQATKIDPGEATAWLGQAGCAVIRRDWGRATELALEAIELRYDLPMAHVVLGRALLGQGLFEEAVQAYRVALHQRPNFVFAVRNLYLAYKKQGGQDAEADHYHALWQDLVAKRRATVQERQSLRDAVRDRVRDNVIELQNYLQLQKERSLPLDLTIVSGLPRSGTSVMMQILQAGGMEILTDYERSPDVDNPEGYLEWEPIKQIGTHPELLREAQGKVVKVVSPLLPKLPHHHRCKVIFMDRPAEEIIASQNRMLQRRGATMTETPSLSDPEVLRQHRDQTLAGLTRLPNMEVLVVPYGALVRNPSVWLPKIIAFVGEARLPTHENMASAIRPELHRNVAR